MTRVFLELRQVQYQFHAARAWNMKDLVFSPTFLLKTYLACYSVDIVLVSVPRADPSFLRIWDVTIPSGRPKQRRYESKPNSKSRCTLCNRRGHNSASCKKVDVNYVLHRLKTRNSSWKNSPVLRDFTYTAPLEEDLPQAPDPPNLLLPPPDEFPPSHLIIQK